jgi:hypothetical protein
MIAQTQFGQAAELLLEAATLVRLADPTGWVSPAATHYSIWAGETHSHCLATAAAAEDAAQAAASARATLPWGQS